MSHRAALVSDSCLEAFLRCRYKSYLKVGNVTGQSSDFERHTGARSDAYRQLVQSRLLPQYRETDVLQSPPVTFQTLQKGKALILDAKAQASSLSATIDVLQRAGGTSLLGDFLYQPIQLCYYDLPTRAATILLAFKSMITSASTCLCGPAERSRTQKRQTRKRQVSYP